MVTRITAALVVAASCLNAVAAQKVVSMPFARRPDARHVDKIKRDTISVTLGNAQRGSAGIGIYYVNTTIGTPGQTIQLQLDTGSSDLWMFSKQACSSDDVMCLGGIFDPSSSSTFSTLYKDEFNISYVTPGSGVHGDYIKDNVNIGGVTVKGLTMGLATEAKEVPTGIMGIGYKENEAIFAQTGGKTSYPNIVDLMVNQSLINTRAYSLYLDDRDAATGTILFGGYDTEKFTGDLSLLDIQPDDNGDISSFTVAWTGFTISTPSDGDIPLTGERFVQPAVLDSGTTLTVLPSEIALQLVQAADAVLDQQSGIYLLYCDKSQADAQLKYQFGGSQGPTIVVPFSELVLPIKDSNGNFIMDGNRQVCLFGIKPGDEGDIFLFGDTFLRSAYVVYDLDGQTIGLAQAVDQAGKSNIVEITGTLGAGLTGASSVASQATARQTATSRDGGFGSVETGAATSALGTASQTGSASFTLGTGSTVTQTSVTKTSSSSASVGPVPSVDFSVVAVIMGSLLMTMLGGAFALL